MRKYYTSPFSRTNAPERKQGLVSLLAAGALACWTPFALAQADPFKPVTADDSCEFGLKVTGPNAWNSPEANGPGDWIDFVLRKAVQYCKDGDRFMIIRGGEGSVVGWNHDYFSVAALLCRRGDIKEEHPLNSRKEPQWQFSCTISKMQSLKQRLAEGKLLYHYPEDYVDPRPGDVGAMRRAPGASQPALDLPPPAAKGGSKSDDCKDPRAPQYGERCGIPLLVAPTPRQ